MTTILLENVTLPVKNTVDSTLSWKKRKTEHAVSETTKSNKAGLQPAYS